MITVITQSEQDKKELAALSGDPHARTDDFFDYRNVVIAKPWGHEYLIFQNDHAAVWILHMRQGHRTSMHCHPNKKTSLTVLAGEARCSTLVDEHRVRTREGLLIEKGVFHSTEALSPEWVIVMEVETPTSKHDLVRLHDAYGRSGKRYEGAEHHREFDESIAHFHNEGDRYGATKQFGECGVTLAQCGDGEEFSGEIARSDADIVTVLNGSVRAGDGTNILSIGDSMPLSILKSLPHAASGSLEALFIKRLV